MISKAAFGKGIYLKSLDWDTSFFGFPCAKLDLTQRVDETDLLYALETAKEYDFVCICNHGSNAFNDLLIGKNTTAYLADTNVQFEKKVSPTEKPRNIIARNNYLPNGEIVAISKDVFTSSRFIRDQRLCSAGGSELYAEWVKNAFCREDKYYLIEERDGRICGFILFSETQDCLKLELIGVSDAFQSMGVGKCLWNDIENETISRNKRAILVGTQMANIQAVNFYITQGCRFSSCNQIYHLWF